MTSRTILAMLAIPAAALGLYAQEGPTMVAQSAVGAIGFASGTGSNVRYFTQDFTFSGRTVTGQPYSADEKTQSVQTLADGTRITNTTTTRVYRDSQGRMRRETTLPALPGQSKPHEMISISDPVSGANYTLDPESKTAHQMPAMVLAAEMKMRAETEARVHQMQAIGPVTSEVRIVSSGATGIMKHEDLGTDVVEGVSATGSRDTSTIEAGEIGNDRPITITNERWMSPELQMEVKSVHSDPRMGETTHTVTNINRSEPDASLFQVPSDYKMDESKPVQTIHRELRP